MKIGDKVVVIDAYFSSGAGEYGPRRPELIGARGRIVRKSTHAPNLFDWFVEFDYPVGYDKWWHFKASQIRLKNSQLFLQFSEKHI